jgi:cysteine desulfurase
MSTDYIYLDANSSTICPSSVLQTMVLWMNKGNPSSAHESAKATAAMIESFKKLISIKCNFTIDNKKTIDTKTADHKSADKSAEPKPTNYTVLITSGASESNATILQMCTNSFLGQHKSAPHFIISGIEHKSIIETANNLLSYGLIELTVIKPNKLGFITAESIAAEIRENTLLVCVMHANNETGVLNDIPSIYKVCHKNNVLLHCDLVQSFGKFILPAEYMDSFSVSFHKTHGPPGVGLLVIKDLLIKGANLKAVIGGMQQKQLRGGTEAYPQIAAARVGLEYTHEKRREKNEHLLAMKKLIIRLIKECGMPVRSLDEFYADENTPKIKPEIEIVQISLSTKDYLPNTLMIAVAKRSLPEMCNVRLREQLEKKNVILSIGSACNTSAKEASHVLYAMDMPIILRKGILRISLPDDIKEQQIKKFVEIFMNILKEFK